jgi:hypothetical protein
MVLPAGKVFIPKSANEIRERYLSDIALAPVRGSTIRAATLPHKDSDYVFPIPFPFQRANKTSQRF